MPREIDTDPLLSLEHRSASGVCQQDDVTVTLASRQFLKPTLPRLIEVGPTRIDAVGDGDVHV